MQYYLICIYIKISPVVPQKSCQLVFKKYLIKDHKLYVVVGLSDLFRSITVLSPFLVFLMALTLRVQTSCIIEYPTF